jgi:hypothetical protein
VNESKLIAIWAKQHRICVLFVFISVTGFAQKSKPDTIQTVKADTIPVLESDSIVRRGKMISIQTYTARFNPRKALLFSAILPGAGQVYNRKYWKVPLVYGGIIGLASVVDFYSKQHIRFNNQLFDFINTGTLPTGITETQLRNIIEQARRQRDYFMIFTGLFYILQLVDAHVDAHLKEFDVNPRLKVSIEPAMENNYLTGSTSGVAIKIRF